MFGFLELSLPKLAQYGIAARSRLNLIMNPFGPLTLKLLPLNW